jgi:hypothetical protein
MERSEIRDVKCGRGDPGLRFAPSELRITISNSHSFVIPGRASWREPGIQRCWTAEPNVWIPGSLATRAPRNDGAWFRVLAAQCVRALPVTPRRRTVPAGVERREAPGCASGAPLRRRSRFASRGKVRPRAPSDVGRSASRRSTLATSLTDRSGFPRSGRRSVQCQALLESAPRCTGRDQDKRGFGDGDKECKI